MSTPLPVSPLAPAAFPDTGPIKGVEFATANSALKYKGRDDVMLARLTAGTRIAGVFTTSATRSASVLDCQNKITQSSDAGAAILVNAGNANAFTGIAGQKSVDALSKDLAAQLDIPTSRIFTSSTGVIGEPLDHGKIIETFPTLLSALSQDSLEAAAQAIRTTDTFAKGAYTRIETPSGPITIAGIAKGSGMIEPHMATMLAYIFTDADIEQDVLQHYLSACTEKTFNAITVDSDTSTSDTVLLAATGASGVSIALGDPDFGAGLHGVMQDLAHQIVRDGEGASKFVRVTVTGAANDKEAKTHAKAIANSPLVKTAIAGADPNWGRIVMAIGKSGAAADRDALKIWFGDILVADQGWVCETYTETLGASYMKDNDEIAITVDVGIGKAEATVWTCDLTHQYISINADYRS